MPLREEKKVTRRIGGNRACCGDKDYTFSSARIGWSLRPQFEAHRQRAIRSA
jgi:hypothetical protein